ncbi:MAG TPA: DUF502 domain-containing protein [Candidatus Heimdallarchaeota archaeon]|nr:DUF502 domain-containing protein [Candidatus Heimdallarchaeota archaeon]
MNKKNILRILRNNFIAGAIVIIPIWVSILLIKALINVMDKTFSLLPTVLQPKTYVSFAGVEILIACVFILLIGFLVNNIIGNRLVSAGEHLLSKIPIVRTVYHGVKHLTKGIVGDKKIFREVVLLEFPIKGLKFIGFVTGEDTLGTGQDKRRVLKIFVPTTPNPTSGFFCYAPEDEVEKMDITVDEAFKLIISAGYANLDTA